MEQSDVISVFAGPLERLELPYMIVGAVGAMAYGEMRFTMDIDVVLELRAEDSARVARAFPSTEFYVPPLETIIVESVRRERGHFNLIHFATGLKADIYLVANDALNKLAMANRRRLTVGEQPLWFSPPEHIILRKLEFYREGGSEKHLGDIFAMLRLSDIDVGFVERHVARLGLGESWAAARNWK